MRKDQTCPIYVHRQLTEDTALYPTNRQLHGRAKHALYPLMGLSSEVGELMGNVKKIMRDDAGLVSAKRRDKIKAELGDILWYWQRICVEFEFDPVDVLEMNESKLRTRKEEGTIQGEGDER